MLTRMRGFRAAWSTQGIRGFRVVSTRFIGFRAIAIEVGCSVQFSYNGSKRNLSDQFKSAEICKIISNLTKIIMP